MISGIMVYTAYASIVPIDSPRDDDEQDGDESNSDDERPEASTMKATIVQRDSAGDSDDDDTGDGGPAGLTFVSSKTKNEVQNPIAKSQEFELPDVAH